MGRHKIYTDKETKERKNKYMLNKEWYCDICNTGRNYTLAGKWCHLKSIKHQRNSEKQNESN